MNNMDPDSLVDFDVVDDRLQWSATKWEKYRHRDVIPLWIADMDFPVAPAIQRAVAAHVAHGNYGYTSPPRNLAGDVVDYYAARYAWRILPEWVVWLSGLVPGIHLAIKASAGVGESVLTFTPIYPPFRKAAPIQNRRTLEVPLALEGSAATRGELRYEIDFARLEATLEPETRLLLLCHPHNPIGNLFSRRQLDQLADFCARNALHVCSDEVHCDLILDPTTPHVPFAHILAECAPDLVARSMTLHGPGKVFNLAGLGISWAVIPDYALRRRFRAAMQRLLPEPCCFAFTALRTALREGETWRLQLLAALRRKRDRVSAALTAMSLPHSHPEATYLTWIDARRLATRVGNPARWFEQRGVGLSDGADFGAPGFLRLNFAAPNAVLDEALRRMHAAVAQLDGELR